MKDLFGIETNAPVDKNDRKSNQSAISLHRQLMNINGTADNKCKNCSHFLVKQYAGAVKRRKRRLLQKRKSTPRLAASKRQH